MPPVPGSSHAGPAERERVLALVQRYGWNATAFQTLESGYRYFFHGDQACVAYVPAGRAWVAAGAPIAPVESLAEVTAAFLAAARRAGVRACFFGSEPRLQSAARGTLRHLRIGEQPVWDPREWPENLAHHRSLREQLRRARAKGVLAREVIPAELESGATREAISRVIERWFATRGMAPMRFLVSVEPFTFPEHRRCFVAEVDGRVVGFAGVVPVPTRNGWFIEDLVRDPKAPNGTGELLIDAVMRWAFRSGSCWLTLGLAPLSGNVPAPLRAMKKSSALLYDFEGLRAFKAKLRPSSWSPIYLSYPATQGVLVSLLDALVAFSGGFSSFALRSLWRGPTSVLRGLTLLLMPWTLLLALAPAEHWFWRVEVKWAWVVFDVLVVAGLLRLLHKRETSLLTVLALAVTCDALLTPVEAALWNVHNARGLGEYALLLLACAAPALAALTLWGARRHRLQP
ncbi:MAG TPA: DUF2156 domain-containing protein [Polyangiaceae bacterium]|jgi:phosphatidylglycerol lysyltransferase